MELTSEDSVHWVRVSVRIRVRVRVGSASPFSEVDRFLTSGLTIS